MRGWRKFRNEKIHTKYSPLYIARVTKLRRIRQTGLAANTVKTSNSHEILF
jgi:hypothetical protein